MFRVSSLVQFAVCAAFTISVLLSRTHSWVVFPAAVAATLHLLNIVRIGAAAARRRAYPWAFARWTFLLATVAFVIAVNGIVLQGRYRNVHIDASVPIAAFLPPAVLQSALLWWPRRKEPEPAVQPG